MKEEIEQWKKENGNITYSIKELLYGIHIKIDKVNKRLAEGDVQFGEIQTILKSRGILARIGFPIVISAMGGLLVFILKLHKII